MLMYPNLFQLNSITVCLSDIIIDAIKDVANRNRSLLDLLWKKQCKESKVNLKASIADIVGEDAHKFTIHDLNFVTNYINEYKRIGNIPALPNTPPSPIGNERAAAMYLQASTKDKSKIDIQ